MSDEYKENAEGQLEINGIDTPLGQAAADYLKAVDALNAADEVVGETKDKIIELLEEQGMKTFTYEGRVFTETSEKVISKTLRVTTKTRKKKNTEE